MASELGKVYVSPDHSSGKFRIMPLKPDGTVNLNVYAHTRTLQFNTFEEAVKYAKGLVAHYGGTVASDTRGKSVNFRPGEKDMMAREVVARKGSKRVELSGPQADGRWVVTVMQEEKQVVPGEANDRFVESKWYSTEAGARRAASKILASRPGQPERFGGPSGLPVRGLQTPEGYFGVYERKVRAGEDRFEMWFTSHTGDRRSLGTHPSLDGAMKIGEQLKSGKKSFRDFAFSRPGAKATFKVEDRFYFGKGRKERFADDAKQIADTILKQLGGGRFIAMTGAKNLAFSSSPPGLRMSIGRGAKDAIKYLRVDYDRGSDTYTMIFANKSGGTVKSVSHVYADSLQRVFTSTTGFDTHL